MKIAVGFWLEPTNKGADHRRTPKKGGSPLGLMPIAHRQTAVVTPELCALLVCEPLTMCANTQSCALVAPRGSLELLTGYS